MADINASPISQLLQSMGMTREDLNKRSNEMRQFLNVNDTIASRVTDFVPAGYRSRSSSDLRSGTRSASSSISLSRSLSRASSKSNRDTSPPATPVKTEAFESGLSLQPRDNMEAVIERQRQSRRERKSKRERERAGAIPKAFAPPPSPSPCRTTSQSSVSLDRFMHSRDEVPQDAEGSSIADASASAESISLPVPVTPQKSKYYRDHTMDSATSQSRKDTACKTETPTPTRIPPQQSLPPPAFYAYPTYMAAYSHYLPVHKDHNPVTPQKQQPPLSLQTNTPTPTQKSKMPSLLPPSSPFPSQSSPHHPSSPTPHILNQVSSPGPMEPLPAEDQYDKLPFKLPPGPYSPNKPDLSYAALVGQAILSSAEHRLTLQEIYDYITIVYPHYKRGETTWMNSIRHVLSTTAVFRKVPRDRSIGRTLWAIYDDDIECFKGGGFRKHLCKDIVNQQKEKAKKPNARKRSEIDDGATSNDTRRSKKARKDASISNPSAASLSRTGSQMAPIPVMGPPQPAFMSSHPYFPRPTQHQPYYESCMNHAQPQMLPAEIIFPPLPADAALRTAPRVGRPAPAISAAPSSSSLTSASSPPASSPPSTMSRALSSDASMEEDLEEILPSSSSSLDPVPELTRSSSTSPPSSALATSDIDIEIIDVDARVKSDKGKGRASDVDVTIAVRDDDIQSGDEARSISIARDDDDEVFASSLLGPVHFWGDSPSAAKLLAPSIELINFDAMTEDEDGYILARDKKGKGKTSVKKIPQLPEFPSSPTLAVRANLAHNSEVQSLSTMKLQHIDRPKTPTRSTSNASSSALPCTPPQQRIKLSSTRTPISHKGLTMSPSASLAHYKSNLDPPPVLFQGGAHRLLGSFSNSIQYEGDALDELLRTPRRSSSSSRDHPSGGPSSSAGPMFGPPVTPKRGGLFDSPFRSGFSGGLGMSPFRTPRSGDIYNPHDPRTVLDEELSRPMMDIGDSPVGIYGKRSALLYDSPGPAPWATPGKKWFW